MRNAVAVHRIRKKPCPYCRKRLQAKSKGQWRNNLARHLENCAPYQREWISMICRFISAVFERSIDLLPVQAGELIKPSDYLTAASKKQEVETLERLYKES